MGLTDGHPICHQGMFGFYGLWGLRNTGNLVAKYSNN